MEKLNNQPLYTDISDVGCVRQLNEDTVYCSDNLWLVADGMGGHARGDVASQLAVATIVSEFFQNGKLVEAIEAAHARVLDVGRNSPDKKGMGTTVVAMSCYGTEYEVAWVGDSRAYLWQTGSDQLTPLTLDHSLVAGLVQSGIINAAQAKIHPQRNMITRCLGSKESTSFKVDSCHGVWQPKQHILLCSDGLTDELSEATITDLLCQGGGHEHILGQLVSAAKKAGGKDNISAILIDSPVNAQVSNWQQPDCSVVSQSVKT